MVIGHQKGRDTKQRVYRNFGQANPEGYRKALRLHEKWRKSFGRPIFTFVDTPGAYPGLGSRGARPGKKPSRAICVRWLGFEVPIITTITGEGGVAEERWLLPWQTASS